MASRLDELMTWADQTAARLLVNAQALESRGDPPNVARLPGAEPFHAPAVRKAREDAEMLSRISEELYRLKGLER